MLRYHRQSLV